MTKLTFFDVDEKEQAVLAKEFAGEKTFELSFHEESLDIHTATIVKDVEGIGIFIQSQIAREVIDLLPKLKIAENLKAYFSGHL